MREGDPIPSWLIPIIEVYKEGDVISKDMKLITPSGQWWNLLTEKRQQIWRELVEFTEKDPDDFLMSMKNMLPKMPLEIEKRGKK